MLQFFKIIFLEFRKVYWITQSRNIKNDLISPIIIMDMDIHFKSHTAVTQVIEKAHAPLVNILYRAVILIQTPGDLNPNKRARQ